MESPMESVVLRVQGMVDRWSRWMRLAPPLGETSRRRFLIVQIDGLSRTLLDRALAGGSLRGLRRLLASGRLALRDLSVGLPSSTPAFQAAIMYGARRRRSRRAPARRGAPRHPRGWLLLRLCLHRRRGRQPVDLRAPQAPGPGR